MCGIYGALAGDRPLDPAWLEPMGDTMTHRGPDDRGLDVEADVALGHRRLSILDLSAAGRQPMWDEARRVGVTYNGEIYNFRELRHDLETRGHRFATRTDTEVLLRAYLEHGDDVVRRLDGMFAFAIWDARRRTLLLSRDRLGKKPLYWSEVGGFVFASELKALLQAPGLPRAVDPDAVADYLAFGYVPSPRTMFRGVRKLRPGHTLHVRPGETPRESAYWRFPPVRAPARGVDLVAETRRLVIAAVEKRLVADVPVGALLSGGIDSGVVVGLMAERTSGLKTFTVAFEAGARSEKLSRDRERARRTAERAGTEHHEIVLDDGYDYPTLVRRVVRHLDEPNANATAVSMLAVSELAAKQGVKVVLTGDGGDEVFAAYPRYRNDQVIGAVARAPRWARNAARAVLSPLPKRSHVVRAERALRKAAEIEDLSAPERYLAWRRRLAPDVASEVMAASVPAHDPGEVVRPFVQGPFSPQDALARADLGVWVADESNQRLDRMTMAVSIEGRSPLLDIPLAEFALSLPYAVKARHGPKWLLRRAFRDILPREVLEGPKLGFYSPARWWVEKTLVREVEAALDERGIATSGILRHEGVRKALGANGGRRSANTAWQLFLLQEWAEAFGA